MKTLNRKRFITLGAIVAGFISLFSFCFGSWTFVQDKDIGFGFKSSSAEPVAYIQRGNDKVYFTKVEKALSSASNEDVYLIPGKNPTITAPKCEVKEGCRLILPYAADGTYKIADYSQYEGNNLGKIANVNFADGSADSGYLKNTLRIASGKTLTNNGTIIIGGIVGVSSDASYQRPTGHTTKDYCQILLEDGASIVCGSSKSSIEVYGYIKSTSKNGTGKIEMKDGIIAFPMVLYDYRGGTYTSKIYDKVFPFSIFDFPNIQSTLILGKKSSARVWAKLPSRKSVTESQSAIHEVNDFYLYSGDSSINSMFKMNNMDTKDSFITMRYVTNNWDGEKSFTKNDGSLGVERIFFDGDIKLSYLKAKVSLGIEIELFGKKVGEVDVDSSKYDLPLCYKWQAEVKTGTFDVDYKVKFMTGSKLTVDEGTTLNINNSTSFYTSYVDQYDVAKVYPDNLPAAECIVNGTMNVNNGFGGIIKTNSNKAKLITSSGNSFSNSVTTDEINGSSQISHIETAKGPIAYNGNASPSNNIFVKGTNFSSAFSNDSFYWTGEVEINAFLSLSTQNLKSLNEKANLTVSLVPDSSYYDLASIKWSISKKKSSNKDQTLNVSSDKMSAEFVASGNPGTYWLFGTRSYEDTYNVIFEIKSSEEFGGKTFTLTSEDITVTGWK